MNITCPIVCHIKFINGTMDFPSDNDEKNTMIDEIKLHLYI